MWLDHLGLLKRVKLVSYKYTHTVTLALTTYRDSGYNLQEYYVMVFFFRFFIIKGYN